MRTPKQTPRQQEPLTVGASCAREMALAHEAVELGVFQSIDLYSYQEACAPEAVKPLYRKAREAELNVGKLFLEIRVLMLHRKCYYLQVDWHIVLLFANRLTYSRSPIHQ